MDIFYHWRDFALDMKERRIGTLGSDGALLEQLKERLPRKVWTFVTPKGKKDRLQLVGSFLITESKRLALGDSNDSVASVIEDLEHAGIVRTRLKPKVALQRFT